MSDRNHAIQVQGEVKVKLYNII